MVVGNKLQWSRSMCSFLFLFCVQLTNFNKFLLDFQSPAFFSCSATKLEEAAILHYTYTKFSDLTSRRDRCGCKPTKEDVKRCFILEFDRLVSYVCFFPLLHLCSIWSPDQTTCIFVYWSGAWVSVKSTTAMHYLEQYDTEQNKLLRMRR